MILPQTPPYARYYDKQGKDYVRPRAWNTVYPCVPIFEFLEGRPWNSDALAIVSMLRPTSIRVSTGEVTADHRWGRVTVMVSEDQTILSIEYEGSADCEEGNGHDLCQRVGLSP